MASPTEDHGHDADAGPGPAAQDGDPSTATVDRMADPAEAQRDRAEGQPGPGLEATARIDPTVATAWVLVIAGYTPVAWVERVLGFAYFGPLAWPAIVAMVGVLFAVIALLRSLDLRDPRLRVWAVGALVVGLVRVLLFPFF